MSIGGHDIVLEVPPDTPIFEVILRSVRQRWPGAYFLGAGGDDPELIDSAGLPPRAEEGREFFVFRDRGAADSWMDEGATAENENTMLHFLIPENPGGSPGTVTMVFDIPSAEMRSFADALASGFRDSRRTVPAPDLD